MSVIVTLNDVPVVGLHFSFGSSTTIPRPFRWHWKRDGVLIAGAPSAKAYTTPPLRPEDLGRKYSVTVFGLDGEIETSDEVELGHPGPIPVPAPAPEPTEPEKEPEVESVEAGPSEVEPGPDVESPIEG